jgi:tRNA (guanine37-N1)-methyltransferase
MEMPEAQAEGRGFRAGAEEAAGSCSMRVDIFTLFPEWFDWFRSQRHVRNAVERGSELRFLDYRETTPLTGGQVDDAPYGGGAGMVLRVDVVDAALRSAYAESGRPGRVLLLTPSGRQFDEALAAELAHEPDIALICGRYEGVDERVREHLATDAVSVGPYVLSGGELAAMVIADAVIRKLPGALGHSASPVEESFSEALGGAPEYPHYTRPASYRGWEVPEVLLSGDHERVHRWRLERSRERADR